MTELSELFKNLTVRSVVKPKKIVKNTQMMRELLDTVPGFKTWECQTFEKPLNIVLLDSLNAQHAHNTFLSTMTSPKGGMYRISAVLRVENPFLLAQFYLKKNRLRELMEYASEREYFHGTAGRNIIPICRENFNWRLTGRTKGHKFGKGVSFSPRSDYSKHSVSSFRLSSEPDLFAYVQNSLTDTFYYSMFLSKVLMNNTHIGSSVTSVPKEGYDGTTNGKGTVYVKYDDSEFYPEYIILMN